MSRSGSPRGVLKWAGALALVLLIGACQQVPPTQPAAKPQAAAPLPPVVQAPPAAPLPKLPPPGSIPGLPAPFERSGTAALLLPMSGQQAVIGQALFNAAQMALYELGDDSFTLLPLDTKGTADGAAAAAQQAVERRADIIIGPLFSGEVKAAAPVARSASIPILAFTTDRSATGQGVYTLGFLPGPQALRVITQAQAAGLTRLAILAPSSEYGRLLTDYVGNNLPPDGPKVTVLQFYDPQTQDWSVPLRRLIKADPKRPGDVGFDALLIPDEGVRLKAIAAALAGQGVDAAHVRLMGTMLWQDAKPGAEPALVGGWYAAPGAAGRADFEQRYQRAYGVKPPRLASLSYDATALAAVLAKRSPHNYGQAVLTSPLGFAGVDGIFRLLADGTAERGYAVYEVQASGNDTEIAPAPAAFQAVY